MGDNLEHLCYQNLDLDVFNKIQQALQQTRPKRCEYQQIWEKISHSCYSDTRLQVALKRKIIILS
jgi:guanosine-3',5'-bis(diphosphate) 3'-pyrophosphohydrolase